MEQWLLFSPSIPAGNYKASSKWIPGPTKCSRRWNFVRRQKFFSFREGKGAGEYRLFARGQFAGWGVCCQSNTQSVVAAVRIFGSGKNWANTFWRERAVDVGQHEEDGKSPQPVLIARQFSSSSVRFCFLYRTEMLMFRDKFGPQGQVAGRWINWKIHRNPSGNVGQTSGNNHGREEARCKNNT